MRHSRAIMLLLSLPLVAAAVLFLALHRLGGPAAAVTPPAAPEPTLPGPFDLPGLPAEATGARVGLPAAPAPPPTLPSLSLPELAGLGPRQLYQAVEARPIGEVPVLEGVSLAIGALPAGVDLAELRLRPAAASHSILTGCVHSRAARAVGQLHLRLWPLPDGGSQTVSLLRPGDVPLRAGQSLGFAVQLEHRPRRLHVDLSLRP